MTALTRRSFLEMAFALGASAAWGSAFALPSSLQWRERRDLYPEGVASGDPDSSSVLLWTRQPPAQRNLTVEVAEDESFRRVVAHCTAHRSRRHRTGPAACSSAASSPPASTGIASPTRWQRQPHRPHHHGARRRRSAPGAIRLRQLPERQQGAQNAYRRMIFEDERAPEPRIDSASCCISATSSTRSSGIPEDRPQGMYDRRIRDIVRYEHGEKIEDFHIPTTVDDYRAVYRAYLHDPDLQDARARWPFVSMWDNHEFSWLGWQGFQKFDGKNAARADPQGGRQSGLVRIPAGANGEAERRHRSIDSIRRKVVDAPITQFDDHGLGQEPNNLTAIRQPQGLSRAALGTQRRSDHHRSAQLSLGGADRPRRSRTSFTSKDFPRIRPAGGAGDPRRRPRLQRRPSAGQSIRFGENRGPELPQRRAAADDSRRRAESVVPRPAARIVTATWKIWGNTTGTLDMRADPQNLPPGPDANPGRARAMPALAAAITAAPTSSAPRSTTSSATTGSPASPPSPAIATASGPALAAKALPPAAFEPVGVAFVTGSISAPGLVEAFEHRFPEGSSAAAAVPRPRSGGRQAAAHGQPAAASRRALVPRIREERRHRQGARASQSRSRAASVLRRHGRTRLRRRRCHS